MLFRSGAGNDKVYVKNAFKGMKITCGAGLDTIYFNVKAKKVKTKGCESVVYGKDAFHWDAEGAQPVWWRAMVEGRQAP